MVGSYLHQVPALQGLGDDGGDGGADAAEDHQVFGAVADGVEEGPQSFGIVTLWQHREERRQGVIQRGVFFCFCQGQRSLRKCSSQRLVMTSQRAEQSKASQ